MTTPTTQPTATPTTNMQPAPTIIYHLLNFEYLRACIRVYNHEDALYFNFADIKKSMPTNRSSGMFASRAHEYIELCTCGNNQIHVLGEVSVKFLLEASCVTLHRMIVDTVIPYALRFIIRRDVRIIRADISLIQKQIVRMQSKLDARVTEVDENYIVGALAHRPSDVRV